MTDRWSRLTFFNAKVSFYPISLQVIINSISILNKT